MDWTNVSYAYQWIRTDGGTDADIAGATDSAYTLTDAYQGKTIKVKVTFNDDKGNSETLTVVAATADVGKKPQFLVSNLGVNVATGIMRPLSAARSGFAQAFTTGTKTDGYALGSVGIQVIALFRWFDRRGPPPGDDQRRRERRRAGRRALHPDQSVELLGAGRDCLRGAD